MAEIKKELKVKEESKKKKKKLASFNHSIEEIKTEILCPQPRGVLQQI